jgi:plastocyanin
MRSRTFALLSIVATLGIISAACSSSSSGGAASPSASASASASGGAMGTITVNGEKANNHGSKEVSGASSLELEADNEGNDYYFNPTVLTGKSGQKLTITVKNEGDTTHNFSLDQEHINQDVQAGKEITVSVTFPKSGDLEFYCAFHRSLGMIGELTTS